MRAIIFDLDHTLFEKPGVLRSGVKELLVILERLRVPVAGLSNRDHRVLVRLEEAGIRHYFASVLCSDQDVQPKEPAGVQYVLDELRASAEHTVFVSHAHADILLAKDAGLSRAIGVSHGTSNSRPLVEAGADHIVEDIPSVLDVLG